MNFVSRIWLPLAVFVAFLLALLNREELYDQFVDNGRFVTEGLFTHGVQIGAWISAAFLANRLITIFFWDGFIGALSERPVPRLPKDVTGIVIFSIAGLAIASTVFHQDTTKIIAASGAVSIVVGLALRTVILDLFMGLAIHVDQPFKMGDWIMVHQNRVETHIVAEIIEINWRTTRLRTTANNMVVVPNSKLGETIVTNYMEPTPHFRMDLDFIIDFEVSAERATRVLTAGIRAACEHKGILAQPEPEVRMKEASLNGMVYEVRYFILPRHISPNESRHEVNRTVLEHLVHSGIMPAHSKEEVTLTRGKQRTLDVSLDEDLYQLITRTELFRSLSAGEFAKVFPQMQKRTLAEGEVLYAQGDAGDSLFVCLEGLLERFVDGPKERIKVDTLRAGQHFGIAAMLDGTARATTMEACTGALVYEIGRDAFAPLLENHDELRALLEEGAKQAADQIRVKQVAAQRAKQSKAKGEKKTAMQKVMQSFFPGFTKSDKNKGDDGDEQK
jgi:small-conductance mechanosensitive channel/CRP-like cAMP-binding protein|tara:strand:+ start:1069 stop:2577 length:1509 start_codon:yes stop_codon:yes gene_type:complete